MLYNGQLQEKFIKSNVYDNTSYDKLKEKYTKYKEVEESYNILQKKIKNKISKEAIKEDFEFFKSLPSNYKDYNINEKEAKEYNELLKKKEIYRDSYSDYLYHEFQGNPNFAQNLLDINNVAKGKHWGAATDENEYSIAFAYLNSSHYKPINKIGESGRNKKFEVYSSGILVAYAQRKYAQENIKKYTQKKYPYIYRGMALDKNKIEKFTQVKNKEIELTGCSAFSFKKEVASHYKDSNWTERLSGENDVPVLISLKRNDVLDESIGMWHDNKDNKDEAAFEVLTGIEKIKIINIKKNNEYYELECEV
jgi:hypothetical protein